MKWICGVLITLLAMQLLAQEGVRSAGVGGVSAMELGVWAVRNNPSGLADVRAPVVSLASRNGYLVPGWYAHQLVAASRLGAGAVGVSLKREGWGDYRKGAASIGYGLNLGEGFRLGWHADYLHRSVRQYFSEFGLTFGVGVQARVSSECWLAGYVQNPVRLRWSNEDPLPALMRIALQWSPAEAVRLETELEYALPHTPRFRAGVEYTPGAKIILRLGAGSGPEILSFGFGYKRAQTIKWQVASVWHWQLGWSPTAGLEYAFGNRAEKVSKQ